MSYVQAGLPPSLSCGAMSAAESWSGARKFTMRRSRASVSLMELAYSDHRRLDERSLALHRLIAQKLQAAPALLERARDNLRRWQQAKPIPSPALTEWEHIMSNPVDEVVAFLVERSERATRLRQSSPFCGILTEAERRAVYESYSARACHPRGEPHLW
jgi:hypothetical protein